jgi:hypothetical protein
LAVLANDSLIVRDLSSNAETYHADFARMGRSGPIAFSPDGTELLNGYGVAGLTLHRLSLADGTGVSIPLPDAVHARLFHWGTSGIEMLGELIYPQQIHVFNLTTGESVQVGSIQRGEGVPYEDFGHRYHAWSSDGTRVAYWTSRCLAWAALFDCSISRQSLFVADTRSGSRVSVAYTGAGSGPTVFSPNGTRLVYHDSDGGFYLVDVP